MAQKQELVQSTQRVCLGEGQKDIKIELFCYTQACKIRLLGGATMLKDSGGRYRSLPGWILYTYPRSLVEYKEYFEVYL